MNVMLATRKTVHAGAIVVGKITARCSVISMRRVRNIWHPVSDEAAVTCKRCLAILQRKDR